MDRLCPAPFAVFFKFNLALHQLFILGGPIVDALALVAGELYESILRHAGHYSSARPIGQLAVGEGEIVVARIAD